MVSGFNFRPNLYRPPRVDTNILPALLRVSVLRGEQAEDSDDAAALHIEYTAPHAARSH